MSRRKVPVSKTFSFPAEIEEWPDFLKAAFDHAVGEWTWMMNGHYNDAGSYYDDCTRSGEVSELELILSWNRDETDAEMIAREKRERETFERLKAKFEP